MRYASVCDGIGAAHQAWQPLGWECAWTSEVDAYPAEVVRQRHGCVNLGDMMTLIKEDIDDGGEIDLLAGGTPCQSFSIAGKRKGMADERGQLSVRFVQLAEYCKPEWIVWENVPGVLSCNKGKDFGAFMRALVDCGYHLAYRVLDAQYFGVPQRRRRLFLVGNLTDARRSAAVLLEPESVRRHTSTRSKAWQETAGTTAQRIGGGSQPHGVVAPTTANCLTRRMHKGINTTVDEGQTPIVTFHPLQDPIPSSDGKTHAITSGSPGGCATVGVSYALRTAQTGSNGCGIQAEKAHTLDSATPEAVAYTKAKRASSDTDDESWVQGKVSPTLTPFDSSPSRCTTVVPMETNVRRLTPLECERLQGFPDDYTAIEFQGKQASNSRRYKALGNSWAVPVARWIGERINLVDEIGKVTTTTVT